jgi:hypothetical protein
MNDPESLRDVLTWCKHQMTNNTPFIIWLAMEPRSATQVEFYFWVREERTKLYLKVLSQLPADG